MTDSGNRPTDGDPSPLEPDEVFTLLRNRRRRHVVEYLTDRGEPVTVRDLSEYVTARVEGKPRAEVTAAERRSVYVGLYQCHLPQMERTGVIAFDRDASLVSPRPALSRVEPYLSFASIGVDERSWLRLYQRVVAGGLFLVLLGPLRAATYGLTVARGALIMAGTVGLCALSHLVVERRLAARERLEHDRFL